jgi:hypothetical protein
MLQMWVLQNHSNKSNVYFVTIMQVFHTKFHIFEVFKFNNATLQYISNLYFKENFNKILMQCSHSKLANIIQT